MRPGIVLLGRAGGRARERKMVGEMVVGEGREGGELKNAVYNSAIPI
jgi:hypothetical protein